MIDSEIEKFISLGIIEVVNHCEGEIISQIFQTPKKTGGVSIIHNLKPLNKHVKYEHFKMKNLILLLDW